MPSPFVPYDERGVEERLKDVRLFITEIAGVLTAPGADQIEPGPADLAALAKWQEAGGSVVLIASVGFEAAQAWCKDNGFDLRPHQGDQDLVVRMIVMEAGLQPRDACYMGATIDDLPAMMMTGVSASVASDDPWVEGGAFMSTEAPGGAGAVAEVIGRLMAGGAPAQG